VHTIAESRFCYLSAYLFSYPVDCAVLHSIYVKWNPNVSAVNALVSKATTRFTLNFRGVLPIISLSTTYQFSTIR
jgi:hypothetical protein